MLEATHEGRGGLSDVLVLCTKNRPADVARCLEAVTRCSRVPESIVVVDSSTARDTERVVAEISETLGLRGSRVTYLGSEPGLPLQRNAGIVASDEDVIHFIDDDTIPDTDYFARILQPFLDFPNEVVGVCGLITNLGPRRRVGLASRAFLLDGAEGTVLPSGINVLVFGTRSGRQEVEWLSGCSMSYRRHVLEKERFDERLSGYALGEDVDLSTRVAQYGRLVHEPTARIAHLESPVERWSLQRRVRTELVHRHDRVTRSLAGERRVAFWWSCIGLLAKHLSKALVRRSRHSLLVAYWTVRGIGDVLRGSRV